jgi:hypothetical protein
MAAISASSISFPSQQIGGQIAVDNQAKSPAEENAQFPIECPQPERKFKCPDCAKAFK